MLLLLQYIICAFVLVYLCICACVFVHLCLCICICVSDGENLPEQTDLVPSGAIMTECEKEVTLTHTSAHARANPRERPIWEQVYY